MDEENPYASPAANSEPSRVPFRPSVFDSWGYWTLRGFDLRVKRAGHLDVVVLREPLPASIGVALLVGMGLVCFCWGTVSFLGPPWSLGPWVFGCVYVALGGLLYSIRERVVLTPELICQTGPFFRRWQIPWNRVVSLTISRNGIIRISSIEGTHVRIPAILAGVRDLPDALQRYLPPNVFKECAADLEIYREFVGADRNRRIG